MPECLAPSFPADFGHTLEVAELLVATADFIIITQTCDLAQKKAPFVALCPIHHLDTFEEYNPKFKSKGQWEQVRKGRIEGLHLLGSPTDPADNRTALVVDFGQIISLPFD